MARRTKYSQELLEELCGHIASGLPIVHACAMVDISEDTFAHWRDGWSKNGKSYKPVAGFAEAIKAARAEFVAQRVSNIQVAAERGNWTADAWLLERMFPDEFALKNKQQVELTGNIKTETQAKVDFDFSGFEAAMGAFLEGVTEKVRPGESVDTDDTDG